MTAADDDAAKAKAAENRKKTGLGVAGGGYLLATRAKDIADPAAEMITRKPAKIGTDLHRIRTAYRAKRITRASQRAGTAAVGAGVLLAGEGVASEMRHRHLIDQARQQLVRKSLGFGEIDKATDPDELRAQAATHAAAAGRAAGKRRRAGQVTLAGGATALGAHQTAKTVERAAVHRVQDLAANIRGRTATEKEIASARRLGRVYRAARRGGMAGVAAGGAAFVGGAEVANHYARKGTAERQRAGTLKGQATRIERRNQQQLIQQALGKSFGTGEIDKAFDPEASRHNRQALYEGGAAGGSVVAAGSAAGQFHRAVKLRGQSDEKLAEAAEAHDEVVQRLAHPGNSNAKTGRRLLEGKEAAQDAATLAVKARRLARGAKGAAIGSAALAGTAAAIHRHDATRGQSYGYGGY